MRTRLLPLWFLVALVGVSFTTGCLMHSHRRGHGHHPSHQKPAKHQKHHKKHR